MPLVPNQRVVRLSRLACCPHLSIRGDEASRASYPRSDHQCSLANQALVNPDWQRSYCLRPEHCTCPTFLAIAPNEHTFVKNPPRRLPPVPIWIILLGLVSIVVFVGVTIVAVEAETRAGTLDLFGQLDRPVAMETIHEREGSPVAAIARTAAEPAPRGVRDEIALPRAETAEDRLRRSHYLRDGALESMIEDDRYRHGVGGTVLVDEVSESVVEDVEFDANEPEDAALEVGETDPEVQPETDASPHIPDEDEVDPAPSTHTVQAGQTLWGIAAIYGSTVESIKVINQIEDPDLIFEGQVLQLP